VPDVIKLTIEIQETTSGVVVGVGVGVGVGAEHIVYDGINCVSIIS
jgi:predicted Co/Zn/Cd cation transporter (cation efflux family)